MILANHPQRYLDDTAWVRHFGEVSPPSREDYGMVQSLRATYHDGLEVEFGLTGPEWADSEGLAAGTREVIADGFRIIFDRRGVLAALLRH